MSITPVDILHTQFKTALRGYNKSQVDEFLRSVGDSLESALKDRADLQRKVDALEDEIDQVRKMKNVLSETIAIAQKTADEVKASAHKQAELIIQEAEQSRVKLVADVQAEAEKCRTEIALLQATRVRFEAEMRALLSGYSEWLDRRPKDELTCSEVA
jgi:cell division initiation protein